MIMTMIKVIVMMIMMTMIITMVIMSVFRVVLDQFQGCSAQKGVAGESITLTVLRLNWRLLAS